MSKREVWVQELDGVPLCVYVKGQEIAGDGVVRYVPAESTQPAERDGELLLVKACDWLTSRGFASAATDLLCNWNDPGNPGDGSCRALHEVPAPPQPKGAE